MLHIFKNQLLPLVDRLRQLWRAQPFQNIVEAMPDGVLHLSAEGTVLYANQAVAELFHLAQQQLNNQAYGDILTKHVDENVSFDVQQLLTKFARHNHQHVIKASYHMQINNQTHTIEQTIKAITDSDKVQHFVVILRDVTRAERLKRKLRQQANIDAVTKLYNRYKFEQRLSDAYYDARDNNLQHALLLLDLDRFKIVNDNAGHAAGDQLLREIAQILRNSIRQTDICARVGGDEFAIILHGVSEQTVTTICHKIVQNFKQFHFQYQHHVFEVGASIGVAMLNERSPILTEVQRQADAASFMAKNQGGNNFCIYDDSDQRLLTEQQAPQWAARIHHAIEQDQFELFAQPIMPINNADQQKQHLEILLRLKQDGEYLSPQVFLPAVERFRLSTQVDLWVVKTAFAWLSKQPQLWQKLVLAINLSGDSIANAHFIEQLLDCYRHNHFPAHAICFEITETAAIANLAQANDFIKQLRELGFTFALDDFGKGFSTFTYLKNLPANYIKIDGSYVQNMMENQSDMAIVKAIHGLAKNMQMLTIAEYVQDLATQTKLKEIGIDFVQGYGIAKPQQIDQYIEPLQPLSAVG